MENVDLAHRFTYHETVNDAQVETYQQIRNTGHLLAKLIDTVAPDGQEKSLAITKVEEAVMWANAAVARNSHLWVDQS